MANPNNITYILGAGASCKSQPLVSDMKERMECLLDLLDTNSVLHNQSINAIFKNKTKNLYLRYFNIVKDAVRHYTPDTFAKKLFLVNHLNELGIFKEFLNLYFLFEKDNEKNSYSFTPKYYPPGENRMATLADSRHIAAYQSNQLKHHYHLSRLNEISNHIDFRYDVFYATLLANNSNLDSEYNTLYLPSNINVISWNYDNQFELAYKEYAGARNLADIYNILYINQKYNKNRSHIIKVNGHCNIFDVDKSEEITFYDQLNILLNDTDFAPNKIEFAWEKHKLDNSGTIDNIIANTDIIIVVGYSFPNFNRNIDKDILDKFNPINNQCVVIQVPENSEYAKIKSRMMQLNPLLKEHHFQQDNNPDQFYIPLN